MINAVWIRILTVYWKGILDLSACLMQVLFIHIFHRSISMLQKIKSLNLRLKKYTVAQTRLTRSKLNQ